MYAEERYLAVDVDADAVGADVLVVDVVVDAVEVDAVEVMVETLKTKFLENSKFFEQSCL